MKRWLASVAVVMAGATMAVAAPPTSTSTAPERASDPGDKIVCKRFIETGSLVRGYRVCKPKREWERERDNIRANGSTIGCNDPNNPACRPG